MKNFAKMTCNLALIALVVAGTSAAFANGARGVPVTDVAATVTQFNYDKNGLLNGILVTNDIDGTLSLLSFPDICGNLDALTSVGSGVTYSGRKKNASDPVSLVKVTAFTPPFVLETTTTTDYPETVGTVDRLNYDAKGQPNGFFFLPDGSGDPALLVITGTDGFETDPPLAAGVAVSVRGTTETNSCGASDPVVVEATFINGEEIGGSCGNNGSNGHDSGNGHH